MSGSNPIELAQHDYALRELVRQLKEIPTQTWPWQSVVLRPLLDGIRFAFIDLRFRAGLDGQPDSAEEAGEEMVVTVPLWEGAVFVSESVQFQVGEVKPDALTIRLHGSIEWTQITQLGLNASKKPQDVSLHLALRQATPEQFDPGKWPAAIDQLQTEQGFEQALGKLGDGLSVLGMRHAPDAWRSRVWDFWGKRVLDRLPRYFLIPVERGPLTLAAGALGPTTPQPLPWTEAGLRAFVERAKATSLKWSELNQLCMAWFERPFPKGIARDEESIVEITLKDGTKEKRSALWTGDGIAVVEIEGRFSVTHLASGLSVLAFATKGKAQRFAEWLQTLPLKWHEREVSGITQGFDRPGRIADIGQWIERQSRVPTLDEVQAHFEGL